MAGLTWTDANGNILDLNDGVSFLLEQGIKGTGMPSVDNRVVVTPTRDGSSWIDNRQEERFIVAPVLLNGTSAASLAALRRTLAQRLNPKLGLGVLGYTPGGTSYALDAVFERHAERREGAFTERWDISWRCPNPFWRATARSTATVVVPSVGLAVPVSIPLSVQDSTATATISNSGDAITHPTVTVAGPITGPKIRNDTTGVEVHFSGLVLASGETLTVDMEEQTATVGTTNVIHTLTPASEFWGLATGVNSVICSTSVGGATFTIAYYLRYEGV